MQPIREDSWPGRPSLTHGIPLGRGPTRVRGSPPRGCCRCRSEEDTGACRPSHAVLPPERGPTRVQATATSRARGVIQHATTSSRSARPGLLLSASSVVCQLWGAALWSPVRASAWTAVSMFDSPAQLRVGVEEGVGDPGFALDGLEGDRFAAFDQCADGLLGLRRSWPAISPSPRRPARRRGGLGHRSWLIPSRRRSVKGERDQARRPGPQPAP
jgi:hypothetical protein